MDSANLHRRLARIMGQVKAIDRMIDEDVPCEDILSHISAAKSALNKRDRWCWRVTSINASVMAGLRAMMRKSNILQKQSNALQICNRKGSLKGCLFCLPFDNLYSHG